MKYYLEDRKRYPNGGMPKWQKYLRKYQDSHSVLKYFYLVLFRIYRAKSHIEISSKIKLGPGAYFGHSFGITINSTCEGGVSVGANCNIHKGVTIGQENRGPRKGVPTIGDEVWIGINATIVGKIRIGNDVLIAPNAYVNCDIPDHSIVIGNPCRIIPSPHATASYINNLC